MSAKPSGSRWASTEEDAAIEARIRKEKEEKRRRKAEKARKLEEQKQAAVAAAAAARVNGDDDDDEDGRPSKRRKITPDPTKPSKANDDAPIKLLRFEADGWHKSRSVERYDKLNDIEEGTYGWVARAIDTSTGKVVALKRLKLDPADRGGLPVTGLREIQILRDCKNRNVVSLEEVVMGDDETRLDRRRRHEPNAPVRGEAAVSLDDADFTGIFQGRDKEEKGAGFSLRMV
ncbi:cell division cycle 2-like [Geosmithia morbida]|uniref:cyclin-dependent kinase n=1 Tax=Geosmithia morbida TaxID=1094350 RepID=A0A9P4YVH1_9HYPO|nr:cell division cycle 2-like [Geosmithia morbida]KAF4123282.1 cell division cycle 2-like [Geosmithia morbida]